MTVLVAKYFTYLKHAALDRLRVRLNVILLPINFIGFLADLHCIDRYCEVQKGQSTVRSLPVICRLRSFTLSLCVFVGVVYSDNR